MRVLGWREAQRPNTIMVLVEVHGGRGKGQDGGTGRLEKSAILFGFIYYLLWFWDRVAFARPHLHCNNNTNSSLL